MTFELVLFPGELNHIYDTFFLKCTVLFLSTSLDYILNALQSFPVSLLVVSELNIKSPQIFIFSVLSVWMKVSLSASKPFIYLHKVSIVKGNREWYATHVLWNSWQPPFNSFHMRSSLLFVINSGGPPKHQEAHSWCYILCCAMTFPNRKKKNNPKELLLIFRIIFPYFKLKVLFLCFCITY